MVLKLGLAAFVNLAVLAPLGAHAQATQHPGLFRGIVMANVDPELKGRLLVNVPSIDGFVATWALPSLPWPQKPRQPAKQPPIGSTVWIEFEGANVDSPVWVGWLPN